MSHVDYCTTTRAAPGEMQVNYNYYLITTLDTQQSWVCHSSHTSTFLFTMSCGQYTEICGHFYARKGDASSSPISRIHSACIGAQEQRELGRPQSDAALCAATLAPGGSESSLQAPGSCRQNVPR